jgi:hypothetical protein
VSISQVCVGSVLLVDTLPFLFKACSRPSQSDKCVPEIIFFLGLLWWGLRFVLQLLGWWRRAALVSTVALNLRSQGGRGDVHRTLAICRLLAYDHEDMVAKAMSWALRELVVHDSEAVADFLAQHKAELAPRIKREVSNKLTTGLKNPQRKAG